jgi:hypothetical protein
MTEVPEGGEDSTIRERATALYTFLKEFTELRSRPVRTIDQYEQVLLFADLPRETGCDCAAWHRGRENDLGESWLEIRQPKLEKVPDPPDDLLPWLVGSQFVDSSVEMPELLGTARQARSIERDTDNRISDNLLDHRLNSGNRKKRSK